MENCKVFCSAHCDHNSGEDYYNICKNPKAVKLTCYGGIDRIYLRECKLLCNDNKNEKDHGSE